MSKRDSYALRISGLADGEHDFSFELDQAFFASLEHSEIEHGVVQVQVILDKKPGVISLDFHLHGKVEVICDRCLEPFMTKIDARQAIFVKMGETPGEIEDEVIMIQKDDHEIEVGQYMYEFIILALPYKRVHPDDSQEAQGCNPEMIQKLEEHRGMQEQKDQIDPRWDALKGIIEN